MTKVMLRTLMQDEENPIALQEVGMDLNMDVNSQPHGFVK